MRQLLPFALAAIATLSFAGCAGPLLTQPIKGYTLSQSGGPNCFRFAAPGDTKIQIYCNAWRPAWGRKVSDVPANCRQLAKNDDGLQSVCADATYWDAYDTLAVNAGVICRWTEQSKQPSTEVCLTAGNWQNAAYVKFWAPRTRSAGGFGAPWGGGGAGSGSQDSYATSYGAFPAGGAIGQTF
jgi:hypothetical protein